jgi:transcriptional regulator
MYNVPHFKTDDEKEVIAFMHAHPFIVLCGVDADSKPVATHLPVLIEERENKVYLHAHVMRKQEHTKAFETHTHVLAIFHAAHTYISASWYQNKQSAGTWNYQAVHVKGKLRFTGEEDLLNVLTKLTEKFENDPASPALVQHMDKGYIKNMMKAIVAFEIEVTDIAHIFKLSQNKDEKSYDNISNQLSDLDADAKAISLLMKERKPKVFQK